MDNEQLLGSYVKSKAINITLPTALLEEIDSAAKANYSSRSDFIRESVILRLKRQRANKDQENIAG